LGFHASVTDVVDCGVCEVDVDCGVCEVVVDGVVCEVTGAGGAGEIVVVDGAAEVAVDGDAVAFGVPASPPPPPLPQPTRIAVVANKKNWRSALFAMCAPTVRLCASLAAPPAASYRA
jgi:hypothetical protein